MNPADFCEYYVTATFFLLFLFNSTLVLLLGISFHEQSVLGLVQSTFGPGEWVQITMSSMSLVLLFFSFLCRSKVLPCCHFKVPHSATLLGLTTFNALGAFCLTVCGGDRYCRSDNSQDPSKCYRRPGAVLPLAWFSAFIGFIGFTVLVALTLYGDAAHTWARKDANEHQRTRRDSLELVRMERSSNGKDAMGRQEGASTYGPPPPYKSSVTPLSSCALPSTPRRKRDTNKLGLTVITDIPTDFSVEIGPPGVESTRPRGGRGLGMKP